MIMLRMASVALEDGFRLRCEVPAELGLHVGDGCVVDVEGVPDFGHVESIEETASCGCRSGKIPRVLRCATLQDHARVSENARFIKMATHAFEELVCKGQLHAHLLRIRYSFDRSVLHVCYSAEEDLDVRDLVRQLEQQLHTRVDMRLLGVRDSAALTGGIGTCGRELCCCSWMRRFEAVNVKMAKVQGLSLNPGAISGSCGRLKCCLRYEYEFYRDAGQRLPRQGAKVETVDGRGVVLSVDVLRQKVKIALEDERIAEYDAERVRDVRGPRCDRRSDDNEDSGAERAELESTGKEGA